ncbi:MAG: glycosyltransferase family 2 protein [Candidatus Binatia bacterium]
MWVSIIIPTRNRADSLKRLLASLQSLECPDSFQVEIVVVDNGSTDSTKATLGGKG